MIKEMDKTGSGVVTFEEWRDFLLVSSLLSLWSYPSAGYCK